MVEQAGKHQPAARRQRAGQSGGEVDQRPGEDVGDEQIVGRARLEPEMVEPRRDDQLELAARAADPDMVERGIFGRHLDRHRIDVGGRRPGRGPEVHGGEGEQAGAGADIGEIVEARAGRLEPVERDQAAGGGLVLAGAEGAAGVDLEGDRARRN